MKYYAISCPNRVVSTSEWRQACAAARLKRIEFSCAENVLENLPEFREQIALLSGMQSRGEALVGSIHIPFGEKWHVASPNLAERRPGIARIERFLRECRVLHCRNYTLHTCFEPVLPEQREDSVAAFRQTLADLMPICRELDLSLNVEILPRSCLGNTAEELARLIDGFPAEHVGVCFDVNHLCNHPEALPDSIRLLAPRIRSFHLSDYDGIDECHWYPMLGVIDWPAVMAEINALTQDVLLIFECYGFINASTWSKRLINPAIIFKNAAQNLFLLEHCDEIIRRTAELDIR